MTAPDQSNRREFLQGRAAAGASGAGEPAPESPTIESATSATPHLVQVTRPAMACEFAVYLPPRRDDDRIEQALAALDLVEQLEGQLSIYREHTEIAQLNRAAAAGPVHVEERLFGLLETALRICRETGGAFDITTTPLARVWGFLQRAGHVPSGDDLAAARAAVGWERVELDAGAQTVRFRAPRTEINLNAIGKGHALDRCREQLHAAGIADFLLHGGQSSVLASGDGVEGQGWAVGLRHPLRPEIRIAELVLRDRALGTSGAAVQHFHHRGHRYGHILDPRTGWPAEGVHSATIVAPTAAEADALATACYVLGREGALDYCQRRNDVGLVLILAGQREGEIEIVQYGFAEGELKWLDAQRPVVY